MPDNSSNFRRKRGHAHLHLSIAWIDREPLGVCLRVYGGRCTNHARQLRRNVVQRVHGCLGSRHVELVLLCSHLPVLFDHPGRHEYADHDRWQFCFSGKSHVAPVGWTVERGSREPATHQAVQPAR